MPKILLVEDNEMNRDMLSRRLQRKGYEVVIAIDGQQVTDPQDISVIMDKHQAGDTVSVTVFRGRRQMTVKLTLGEAHQQVNL